ncbi:PEP/pyruvate-binding domain-containing protein [Dictyobacter arantiisoli]|uniref:Phosphoenolpyruvate synthase n=1 Tax=Dictyobacter arantiisoli TaxID=2014874 RepID=A0A5A5TE59_9CHLR|nr:PEP/pyruvate-binding domain-containing protein [Dictyobacter arantiisoli]GCF09840.1 phosphoenolpyruvate synthase [Dictyobacter arantiisoli]
MSLPQQEQKDQAQPDSNNFVLPFSALHRDILALVGGKAANLGELTNAKLPVPPGFCVTTTAYALVAEDAGLQSVLDTHAPSQAGEGRDAQRLTDMAQAARHCILATTIPTEIADAIIEAYDVLGSGKPIPVAVRSSATAEDLPFASFAGQQDTYLNIVGIEAVLDAVQRCWASLWTERAVSYRENLGLDQSSVKLAVVVQRMIQSSVAGVLFTANPVTGKRRQAVIDANPGLGEAVVSGATNPDHFVVNTTTGEIVERRLGDKRVVIRGTPEGGTLRSEISDNSNEASLSDEQIRSLAELGASVEVYYGQPQDTEWAIDPSGQLWLTQSRPITTLYPLPANVSMSDDELRVYFSINVFQGVYRPFTPAGRSTFRLIGSGIAAGFGYPQPDPLNGPSALIEAGQRLFFDVTPALRNKLGRRVLIGAASKGEALSAPLFKQLTNNPRFSIISTKRWPLMRAFEKVFEKTRAPIYILQALFWPEAAVKRVQKTAERIRALNFITPGLKNEERLRGMEHFVGNFLDVIGGIAPVLLVGLGSQALAGKLLGDLAKPEERQVVLRGLPHNPTTAMDLELWHLAQSVSAHPDSVEHVHANTPEQLAQEYRTGTLPPLLQQGLTAFLALYGHRGVAEIDLGLPRWSEDPTHILGALSNYLHLNDPSLAPPVQFQRGAKDAENMLAELVQRTRSKGWLRSRLVHFFLRRTHDLVGLREMPKFTIVLLIARMRDLWWTVGKELEQAGRLETAGDVFFLSLPEIHTALAGEDMHNTVLDHRTVYDFEMRRRHIPRVLLSDGTEPGVVSTDADDSSQGVLRGTPASPGTVTAKARVILDPTGAQLLPGEILVAPSTDPGWTPLFLTAGGLVMEMGGAISHGAVVAREYGIPAIVGVPEATERITTGQRITVDGATGKITIEEDAQTPEQGLVE